MEFVPQMSSRRRSGAISRWTTLITGGKRVAGAWRSLCGSAYARVGRQTAVRGVLNIERRMLAVGRHAGEASALQSVRSASMHQRASRLRAGNLQEEIGSGFRPVAMDLTLSWRGRL